MAVEFQTHTLAPQDDNWLEHPQKINIDDSSVELSPKYLYNVVGQAAAK
jgi:hypothetical protein